MQNESSKLQRFSAEFAARIAASGEALVVLILALVSLAVHGHYKVTGLGESDAARFARLAFAWHARGKLSFDEVGYQIRTSTLYIQLERVALDRGLPLHSLPDLVNWVSVFFGTACSIALYRLFSKLTTRPIAATATLVYALTPGFWLGNIYGMPTIPGMFFLFVALTVFVDATRVDERNWAFFARMILAWFFMAVAMMVKSDLVLCGGAFLGAALVRPNRRWQLCGWAVFVVLGATAASVGYTHAVVSPSTAVVVTANHGTGLLGFLKSWNESFAISLDALLTDSNNTVISRCVGGLLFGVIVLALAWGLTIGGLRRKQALLALLWGLPPILSWGLRFGNSARHNVPAFPPLVLFATIFLFDIVKQNTTRAATLALALMCASYFSNTSGNDALKPQSNLIALSEVLASSTRSIHDKARAEAQTPGRKRVLVAGYADAYTEFELLSAAKKPTIEIGDNWVVKDGDQTTVIDYNAYLGNKSARQLAREYRRDDYEVLSISYRL